MASTSIKKCQFLCFLIYVFCSLDAAAEMIAIQISAPNGSNLYTEQPIDKSTDIKGSEPIYIKISSTQYQAIKCKGPWGATKYKKWMTEGPGFKLYQSDKQLLIQVVEHRVISADIAINSMSIHCMDAEPKQVIKSIAEIVIERSINSEEILEFDNGYKLSYQYSITKGTP
ncbi:hypothetical protein QT397_06980 [Microbulbifer sp. MKSA007]|nr:hypothetical protein QT397_06980 [Microbulbifer sp. MKSA007]